MCDLVDKYWYCISTIVFCCCCGCCGLTITCGERVEMIDKEIAAETSPRCSFTGQLLRLMFINMCPVYLRYIYVILSVLCIIVVVDSW